MKFILIFCLYIMMSVSARRVEFLEQIERLGYKGEYHWVTTDDGYILRLDRITYSPVAGENSDRPVVYIQHGVIACSEMFVFWRHNSSLAYLLADTGYDVWLGNSRGTTNSRNHTHLSPDKHPFWNYDIHDLAIKDLPPMINYILEKTGREQLSYIGHSMGTTMMLGLLSEMPEYNDKLNFVILMAPIAFWARQDFIAIEPVLATAIETVRVALDAPDYAAEVFNAGGFVTKFCGSVIADDVCTVFLNLFLSHSQPAFDMASADYITDYFPAGASLRIMENYFQNIERGDMRQYDYGLVRNLRIYGQSGPAGYDLSRITVPIATISSLSDKLATPNSVAELLPVLSSLVTHFVVPDPNFVHNDYFFNENIRKMYGNKVLELMEKYNL